MLDSIMVLFIPAEKWYKRSRWKLLENYISSNNAVNVPAGFVTDGASIPIFLHPIFSPVGRYFGASIIHDYILITEHDWEKANYEMEQELIVSDIPKWRRMSIITAIKIYSKVHMHFNMKFKANE